jgi:hypothetical protein
MLSVLVDDGGRCRSRPAVFLQRITALHKICVYSVQRTGGFWFVSASLGLFSATRAWLGHMQTVMDNQG